MASASPTPSPIPRPTENQPSATKIEALGVKVEVPFPKWAVSSLAVVVIAVAVGAGVYYSYKRMTDSVLMPLHMVEEYEESSFHQIQPDQLKDLKTETFNDLITVKVTYFKSDGCLQIVRLKHPLDGDGESSWMFGAHPHSAGHAHATTSSESKASPLPPAVNYQRVSYIPKSDGKESWFRAAAQGGRCISPHPGTFSVRNEKIDRCNIKAWRTFADGCVHYQLFNACRGTWAVSSTGAPLVNWTRCVH